jgi:tetratricopeptide (TPR) repeat protein
MNAALPKAACRLDAAVRDRFRSGSASGEERRAMLRHLFAGCQECIDAVRPQVRLIGDVAPPALPMSRMLRNLADFERRLGQERSEAAELWQDFQRHPVQRQWTLLRNSSRYNLAAFAELLLDASFEAVYDDPRRSLDLAEMGEYIAATVEDSFHGDRALHDLRGRALARLANAQRATSDLLSAEKSIAAAGRELEQGSGEPLLEAEYHYFRASIHRAQRRFDQARAAVLRSRRIYRAVGDAHLEGRSLLNEALIQELDGDLPGAIERIQRAIPMIEESRDRHLFLGARHNLLWCLTAAGRAAEAAGELEELRPRYQAVGDRMSLILLRWMEGRIALQLGQQEKAEAAFRECHDAYVEREIPYEAATVAFDLAALLAQQGRTPELKALASELVAVFHRLGIQREAIAALLLFERAAQAEAVTTALAAKLARYFEAARTAPGKEFSPADLEA